MEELAKRKNIIVTNADKVGAVVITEVENYINEANPRRYKMTRHCNTVG